MTEYVNLDKLNDILASDKRKSFTKHDVWLLLNMHREYVIKVDKKGE